MTWTNIEDQLREYRSSVAQAPVAPGTVVADAKPDSFSGIRGSKPPNATPHGTEVSRAFGMLAAAEETLRWLVAGLNERLEAVMRPAGPEVARDKVPESNVPLAMALLVLSEQIAEHNSRLGDIINRIEV